MAPGETAKAQPRLPTASSWVPESTVPAPTMAPSTSSMMALMAFIATGVRRVISSTSRPPAPSLNSTTVAAGTSGLSGLVSCSAIQAR